MPTDRVVEPEEFAIALEEILKGFDQAVKQRVPSAVDAACKEGRKQTVANWKNVRKGTGPALSKGPYSSGFAYKVEETSLYETRGVIYNRKYAGLVHLLEIGHNTMGGGRVTGSKHLAVEPTREELMKQLLKKVDEVIG